MIKSVLVAIDGSDHSWVSLDLAGEIAAKFEARLTLIHVAEDRSLPEDLKRFAEAEHVSGEAPAVYLELVGRRLMTHGAERARSRGVTEVETVVETGDPASTIVAYAAANSVDLIVMGRRGVGTVRELLLGSVSHKVSQLAACPCLTVL